MMCRATTRRGSVSARDPQAATAQERSWRAEMNPEIRRDGCLPGSHPRNGIHKAPEQPGAGQASLLHFAAHATQIAAKRQQSDGDQLQVLFGKGQADDGDG